MPKTLLKGKQVDRSPAYAIACRICGALPGRRCMTYLRKRGAVKTPAPHLVRAIDGRHLPEAHALD